MERDEDPRPERPPPQGSWFNSRDRKTLEKICTHIMRTHRMSQKEFFSRNRRSFLAEARQIAMYLVRKHTVLSFPEIGAGFNLDHSTIQHGVRKIERQISSDQHMSARVAQLEAELGFTPPRQQDHSRHEEVNVSASYYAHCILGAKVEVSDFIDRKVEDIVVCDHEEGKKFKFCPTCGTAAGERIRRKRTLTWKAWAEPYLSDVDPQDFPAQVLDDEDHKIEGLGLYRVTDSSENEGFLVLGVQVGSSSSWGDEEISDEVDAEDLIPMVMKTQTKVQALLGLERKVTLFTFLQVNI